MNSDHECMHTHIHLDRRENKHHFSNHQKSCTLHGTPRCVGYRMCHLPDQLNRSCSRNHRKKSTIDAGCKLYPLIGEEKHEDSTYRSCASKTQRIKQRTQMVLSMDPEKIHEAEHTFQYSCMYSETAPNEVCPTIFLNPSGRRKQPHARTPCHINSPCSSGRTILLFRLLLAAMLGPLWKFITGNDRIHITFCVTGSFCQESTSPSRRDVGIVGCLMLYGVLQERIMAEPFAPDGAMFRDSLFLVEKGRRRCVLNALFCIFRFCAIAL